MEPSETEMLSWFDPPLVGRVDPLDPAVRAGFIGLADAMFKALPEGPDKTRAMRQLQGASLAACACR